VNIEIERRFLVNESKLILPENKKIIKQAYLFSNSDQAFRVRIIDNKSFITYKHRKSKLNSYEFEYLIPKDDAEKLIQLSNNHIIHKDRYYEPMGKHIWEIDVFYGENKGLVIAEIELDDEREQIELPDWIDREISQEKKYFNFNLSKDPFLKW
tara:strand:- start:53077 stop:53538 length:462 start_codon:yes stop_codon:yes gene_type:complete